MNEPFEITTPNDKSPAVPEEIIIDIHVDLSAGSIYPQQVLILPARVSAWARFVAAFKNIFGLPKPIGRLVFDLLGRHDIADTSSVILGWLVILIALLLFRDFIPINMLINWLVSLVLKTLLFKSVILSCQGNCVF
jgi:hypothetical protein